MKYVFISPHARDELENMAIRLAALQRVYADELIEAALDRNIPANAYLNDLNDMRESLQTLARLERI